MPKRKDQNFDLKIVASVLATRDAVSRLLAYAAAQSPDRNAFLQEFSEATDSHIHKTTKTVTADDPPDAPDDGLLEIQEQIRKEIDWYVASARKMLE